MNLSLQNSRFNAIFHNLT